MRVRWLLIVPVLMLSACAGDEHEELRKWMEESSKDLKGKVPPLPQLKTFPVVAYDAGALPDPFKPAKLETAKAGGGGGIKPDLTRRREPLESYPLETLKMVGVLNMGGRPEAVISADKTLFRVRVGQYMGQNFGVVTKITDGDITLKELVEDTSGDWVERVTTLQLQEQEAKK